MKNWSKQLFARFEQSDPFKRNLFRKFYKNISEIWRNLEIKALPNQTRFQESIIFQFFDSMVWKRFLIFWLYEN